eukprot:585182-Pleurochrysis_carterae.AAC.1
MLLTTCPQLLAAALHALAAQGERRERAFTRGGAPLRAGRRGCGVGVGCRRECEGEGERARGGMLASERESACEGRRLGARARARARGGGAGCGGELCCKLYRGREKRQSGEREARGFSRRRRCAASGQEQGRRVESESLKWGLGHTHKKRAHRCAMNSQAPQHCKI